MQNWEYLEICLTIAGKKEWTWTDTNKTTKQVSIRTRLNELGLKGWELVTAYTYSYNGYTNDYYYILKRPIE